VRTKLDIYVFTAGKNGNKIRLNKVFRVRKIKDFLLNPLYKTIAVMMMITQ